MDTNLIVDVWQGDLGAVDRLRAARQIYTFAICPIAYTELFAHPGTDRHQIESFLAELRVEMVQVSPQMWTLAGERYARMAERRRQARGDAPRRIAADFIIGAHALLLGGVLLTSDIKMYERNFPEVSLL